MSKNNSKLNLLSEINIKQRNKENKEIFEGELNIELSRLFFIYFGKISDNCFGKYVNKILELQYESKNADEHLECFYRSNKHMNIRQIKNIFYLKIKEKIFNLKLRIMVLIFPKNGMVSFEAKIRREDNFLVEFKDELVKLIENTYIKPIFL